MYRKNEWDSGPSSRQFVPARAPNFGEIIDVEPVSPAPVQAEAKAPAPMPAEIAAATPVPKARSPGLSRRQLALGALLVAGLGAGAWFGYDWWTVGRFTVTTDDAYVEAHNTTLAAKVSGYLASVLVDDNSHVHAGDVIATIDDGDYRLAADSAREKAATQQVDHRAHRPSGRRPTGCRRPSQGTARFGQRCGNAHGVGADAADHARRQGFCHQTSVGAGASEPRPGSRGGPRRASRDSISAAANVDVLKGQQQEAIRTLAELKTSLAKAERDLSFTVIRAPIDGVIGNRAVQTGDYVQTGTAACEPRSARRGLRRRQLQGDAACRAAPRPTGFDRGRRAARARDPRARSKAFRRRPARCSRCCRRTTPPATSPRSCSGCRCASTFPPPWPARALLRPGMSVVVSVNTKQSALANGATRRCRPS